MTVTTPRVASMFEKTKTVCFGRFLIDIPASSTVIWGSSEVPFEVSVYLNRANEMNEIAEKFIEELAKTKAIYHNHEPLLISNEKTSDPEGIIVTGYENFESINALKINGYFKLEKSTVFISSRPLQSNKDRAIARIKSIAKRLQERHDDQIPIQPGNCIENAFLPDESSSDKTPLTELIRIGFRLKEFPDTHLSILISPSNPNHSESNSLRWQLDRLENEIKVLDSNHPQKKTKYLRKGERQIHGWMNGFEALSVTPEQGEIHAIHDFAMDFSGAASDPLRPYADIRMQTGVADNTAGVIAASLDDDEAIAVWDRMTSTIRVRPTKVTQGPSAEVDLPPRVPLGELAATGRVCPQTGWWVATGSENSEIGQRQRINAGERMPHFARLARLSIWHKLKGKSPTYREATVWKLVAYDGAAVSNEIAPLAHVQASVAHAAIELAPNRTNNGDPGEGTSSETKI